MTYVKNFLSIVFNFVPFIMIGYGWYFVPSLKLPIMTGPAPFEWLVYSFIAAIVWLAVQVYISTSRNTGVGMLQMDALQGITFALIIAMVTAYTFAQNITPWALAVPFGMTLIDAVLSTVLSINNAAQKPLVGGAASQGKTVSLHGNKKTPEYYLRRFAL